MLKLHIFYQKYANTPTADRFKDIGGITLKDIYVDLNLGVISEERKEELLKLAEIYYKDEK